MADFETSKNGRLFFIEGGAGPAATVTYEPYAKVTRPTLALGDITSFFVPHADTRGKFKIVGSRSGTPTAPTMPITVRRTLDLSKWLRLANGGCNHDLLWHEGLCTNPQDFNRGYDLITVLETARITNWSPNNDLGALSPDQDTEIDEEVPFSGQSLYQIKRFNLAELLASTIARPLIDVALCDDPSCGGVCGLPSNGCQKVYFLSSSTVGSPGTSATVYVSDDGGATAVANLINTLSASENPNAFACVGENLVVVSEDSESLHYAVLDDLQSAPASTTWTEVSGTSNGWVATKGPLGIYAAGPNNVWISAEGGYIYYTENPPDGVEVQSAGSVTTQDLNDVHGIDDQHVVAVGASNAVVITHDGGETWASKTGPAVGVVLNRVWMRTKDEFWIAAADGSLYYTLDGGDSWSTSGFSGSGSGNTHAITFFNRLVGLMAHTTSGNVGRAFKTINGGKTWALLPEKTGTSAVPSHRTVERIVMCDQNTFYGAGLSSSGSDGFALKGA